jgi:hypothetical protein
MMPCPVLQAGLPQEDEGIVATTLQMSYKGSTESPSRETSFMIDELSAVLLFFYLVNVYDSV